MNAESPMLVTGQLPTVSVSAHAPNVASAVTERANAFIVLDILLTSFRLSASFQFDLPHFVSTQTNL